MSPAARRASSRRSQCTCDPRPGGSPVTTTSTTPPRVSPSLWAASTSATIAAEPAGSNARTGSASSASTSSAVGSGASSATDAAPMATVWETRRMPYAWSRKRAATSPRATRAAVSRAEARSSTGRASSNAYFCIPTRSAWPGRGRVSGRLRAISFSALTSSAAASSSASTGSGLMTVLHFGHSVFPTRIATGDPRVRPWRTPPRNSTSSCSNLIRAPRP